MYVAMIRKMDNVADIQNSVCGQAVIMIWISIFKSARNDAEQGDDKENIPHGTKVLKEIVLTWANMNMIVCADAYFASVPATK